MKRLARFVFPTLHPVKTTIRNKMSMLSTKLIIPPREVDMKIVDTMITAIKRKRKALLASLVENHRNFWTKPLR